MSESQRKMQSVCGMWPGRALVPALLLLLSACASTPPSPSATPAPASTQGRYQMERDSGVLEPIDLDRIRPVIPKVEQRTAAGNKSPYTINGVTYRVLQSEEGFSEVGMASWYGRKFHGHLTSNGERYDMFQISAAHTRLPIPSYIRVTNLENGLSIIARVNDRGPFHPGRVVDLSYAGAVLLGYAGKGTARVRVEAIVPERGRQSESGVATTLQTPATEVAAVAPPAQTARPAAGQEFLQVGAFASRVSAERLVERLSSVVSAPVAIHSDPADDGAVLHKVRIGPLADAGAAAELIETVQRAQLGTPFKIRI